MAYEYRVTEAADGTFPVELWSSKGGREQLVYRTHGFQTWELAEAWIVPVEVQSATGDPPQPRARVTYLKPRRSPVVIVSKPNPHPPLASPPALPESLNFSQSGDALSGNAAPGASRRSPPVPSCRRVSSSVLAWATQGQGPVGTLPEPVGL